MSISSVSSTPASDAARPHRPDPMANVAKLLDMSTADLRSALKSGSSLSDLATKQGVSRDDLLKTLESDLKNRPARPGDGSSAAGGASSTDLAAEAAKIADTKGLPKHSGHHHRDGSSIGLVPSTATASTVSSQLAAGGAVDVLL